MAGYYRSRFSGREKQSSLEKLLSQPIVLIIIFFSILVTSFPLITNQLDLLIISLTVIVIFLAIGLLFFIWYSRRLEMRRLRALEIDDIDRMSGVTFERYVGELLKDQGYQIHYTPLSGDFGTDIVARRDNDRISVQTKRYRDAVNLEAVQQAVASMPIYGCNKSMVVTNNYFLKSAKDLARATGCELIDRIKLADWILKFRSVKS